jgi:predicted permease
MGNNLKQIVVPFRSVRFVLSALAANFLVVPLVALAFAITLHLDEPLTKGLLLLGAAAGAPLLLSQARAFGKYMIALRIIPRKVGRFLPQSRPFSLSE